MRRSLQCAGSVPRLVVPPRWEPESGVQPNTSRWFPRHQYVGMQRVRRPDAMPRDWRMGVEMGAKLRDMDAVVEVHDARIPLCGRNADFAESFSAHKPHILVLNKIDLVNLAHREAKVTHILKEKYGVKHVLWTNMKKNMESALRSLIQILLEESEQQPRYQKLYTTHYQAMVIGVPNVGKSTLINALRRQFTGKKAALLVGDKPGVTRAVHNKMRIHEDPPIYILDTPGVMTPKLGSAEVGLKLALCNTVADKLVNQELLVDFLLWKLHSRGNFEYLAAIDLPGPPTNSAFAFLVEMAKTYSIRRQTTKTPSGGSNKEFLDLESAARQFVRKFRIGQLGDQFLDDDILEKYYPPQRCAT